MASAREEAMTDERLDSLERWRDVEFKDWQKDIERRFAEAFPGGDHVGHCRYHELMIEHTEEVRRLRRAIIEKTASGLVWGVLVALGATLWFGVLAYLKSLKGGG